MDSCSKLENGLSTLIRKNRTTGSRSRVLRRTLKATSAPSKKKRSTLVDYRNVVQKMIPVSRVPTTDAEYAIRRRKRYSTSLHVVIVFVSPCTCLSATTLWHPSSTINSPCRTAKQSKRYTKTRTLNSGGIQK